MKNTWNLFPDRITKIIKTHLLPPAVLISLRKHFNEPEQLDIRTPAGEISIELPPNHNLTKESRNPRSDPLGRLPEAGYEPTFVQTLADVVSEEDIVYDIGAAAGFFITVARTLGVPDKNIHAFEYEERYCEYIRKNHPDVKLIPKLVGRGLTNNSIQLSEYIKNNPSPDIIKIDVEGDEFTVLRGVNDCLDTLSADLFIEVHPLQLDPTDSVPELVEYLECHGFSVKWADHRKVAGDWISFDDGYPKPSTLATKTQGPYMIWAVAER